MSWIPVITGSCYYFKFQKFKRALSIFPNFLRSSFSVRDVRSSSLRFDSQFELKTTINSTSTQLRENSFSLDFEMTEVTEKQNGAGDAAKVPVKLTVR